MDFTKHAERRAAQRGFSEDELSVLSAISLYAEQCGGTSLCTVPIKERNRWVGALKEVILLLRNSNMTQKLIKQKIKVIKRLIEKLSAKHLPYFVLSNEGEQVITCGHYYNKRIGRG